MPSWTPMLGGFFSLVLAQFDEADQLAFGNIIQYIQRMAPGAVKPEDIAQDMYEIIVAQYGDTIDSKAFKAMIIEQVRVAYQDLARTDAVLPRSSFALPDERAMQYLEQYDLVYLGRYVEGGVLRARILDWVKENYLKNGAPIGNSDKELRAFIKEFGEELDASRGKVRELIDTTVSRARIFGQVNGMRAAGGKTFEIAGPDDAKTCSYCREMVGRTFDVAAEISRQDSFIQAGPDHANAARPFLNGHLDLEDVEDMSDSEVQDLGFATPPYHPSCRHRLIAVSFYTNLQEIPYALG